MYEFHNWVQITFNKYILFLFDLLPYNKHFLILYSGQHSG